MPLQNYLYNDEEIVQEIIDALEPINQTVLKLSEDSCDLMTAEGSIMFLLKKLKAIDSNTSQKLYFAVLNRINERRKTNLVSTLIFLHSGQYPKNNDHLGYSSKKVIKETIASLSARLFPDSSNEGSNEDEEVLNTDEMTNEINQLFAVPPKLSSLENDIKQLALTGMRSQKLDQIYKSLKSIQATSTLVERVFSVCSSIKTKVRNRLSPKKLSMLVFLKYIFIRNKK